jgi:hypothetical protein
MSPDTGMNEETIGDAKSVLDYTPEQIEQIAEACHESNREYCAVNNLLIPPPWAELSEEIQTSIRAGVVTVMLNPELTPQELHGNWANWRRERGWNYGPVKDEALKTHPNMVPWVDLPDAEQVKDVNFMQTVRNWKYGFDNPGEQSNEGPFDPGSDEEAETIAATGVEGLDQATIEEIIGDCYESERNYRMQFMGDTSRPEWKYADEEIRQGVIDRVFYLLEHPDEQPENEDNAIVSAVYRIRNLVSQPTVIADGDEDKNGGGEKPGLVGKTCQQSVESSRDRK